jgi:hypothetical protein
VSNYDDMRADQILELIIADREVDIEEVRALARKLDQDWVVDHAEVELLFRVNQALGQKDISCPEWTEFFANNVSRLLIMDLDTPGEIDSTEGDWLSDTLDKYGVGNTTELELLKALRKRAAKINGRLAQRMQQG